MKHPSHESDSNQALALFRTNPVSGVGGGGGDCRGGEGAANDGQLYGISVISEADPGVDLSMVFNKENPLKPVNREKIGFPGAQDFTEILEKLVI